LTQFQDKTTGISEEHVNVLFPTEEQGQEVSLLNSKVPQVIM
jgi:hypothetical protein